MYLCSFFYYFLNFWVLWFFPWFFPRSFLPVLAWKTTKKYIPDPENTILNVGLLTPQLAKLTFICWSVPRTQYCGSVKITLLRIGLSYCFCLRHPGIIMDSLKKYWPLLNETTKPIPIYFQPCFSFFFYRTQSSTT